MMTATPYALAYAVLCLASFRGSAEVGVSELPVDDACSAGSTDCGLSFRQLRTSKQMDLATLDQAVSNKPDWPTETNTNTAEHTAVHAAPIVAQHPAPRVASADAADTGENTAAEIASEATAVAAPEADAAPDAEVDSALDAASAADADDGAMAAALHGNATIEATGNACVGQTGWDADFARHAYSCAFRTLGNAYRSGRCMAHVQHVSSQCGACIGGLIHCGMKCVHECCYGKCNTAEKCLACSDRNCRKSFMDCAGLPPPRP